MDAAEPRNECEKCRQALGLENSGDAWDGQWLCRDCITTAVNAEFGDAAMHPEESVQFGFLESLGRGARSALIGNTLFAGTIFAFFLLIRFAYQLSQVAAGKQFAAPEPMTWLYFFGFSWAFCGIVSFPLVIGLALASRSRTIRVDDQHLVHQTVLRTQKIPLADCVWFDSPTGFEGSRGVYWRRPLVGIYDRKNPQQALVCGFSEHSRRLWTGYFLITLGSRHPGLRGARILAHCLRGLMLGGAVGVVLGGAVQLVTGDPRWIMAFTMVGFLDGFVWEIVNAALNAASKAKSKQPIEVNQAAIAFGLIGSAMLVGAKLGILAGFRGAIVCGTINALLAAVGWMRIKAALPFDRAGRTEP